MKIKTDVANTPQFTYSWDYIIKHEGIWLDTDLSWRFIVTADCRGENHNVLILCSDELLSLPSGHSWASKKFMKYKEPLTIYFNQ